jgi:NTP pyrophosphatase (non-canonical NTP hydrolase)
MDELLEQLRKFRDDRDWAQFHTPKDLAVSVSIEASELLELFQWRPDGLPLDADLIAKIKGEVADVLLYLLLLCDAAGFNLTEVAQEKIDLNAQRFPVLTSRGLAKPNDELENR